MNHATRLGRLQASIDQPLLVTKAANLRYLTGFGGTNGFLVVTPQSATFVTDGRYAEIVEELLDGIANATVEVYTKGLPEVLAGAFGDASRVTVEADAVTWAFATSLQEAFDGGLDTSDGIVEGLRRVKDDDEVEALRRAAAAGDAAFAGLESLLRGVSTEGELARALIDAMQDAGGSIADWPPIVAAGANAARPHHQTGSDPITDGLLLLDYGCIVDGYHSDMTRTVWLGPIGPGADVLRLYNAVYDAQQAAIAAVAPGVEAKAVDAAARDVLADHGLAEHFLHSTGHGVGLEIHEEPWVATRGDTTLEPGHVITIEPGAYVTGLGGVRIEDMVLVTPDGHEVLTASPKELS